MGLALNQPGIALNQLGVNLNGYSALDPQGGLGYRVQIANGNNLGVFIVGTSTIGGSDVIGGSFGSFSWTDLSADVKAVTFSRGRDDNLAQWKQGTASIRLRDPGGATGIGKYNPNGGYTAQVLYDNPVLYLRLDELSGTTATDASGYQNNGTYSGGYTLGVAGALSDGDQATKFDGVSGKVATLDTASLRLMQTGSVDLWIYPLAWTATYQGIVNKGNEGPGTNCYGMYVNPSFNLQMHACGSPFTVVTAANDVRTACPVGQWSHLALTWDGITMRTYINGVAGPTGAMSGSIPNTAGFPLNIGFMQGGSYVNAVIDEVAVYPTALPASRILAHYNAQPCLAGQLSPLRPIRCQLSFNGTWYTRFYGFFDRVIEDPNSTAQECTIFAVDFFEVLNNSYPQIAEQVGKRVDQIITLIFNNVGINDPTLLNIQTGGDTIPSWNEAVAGANTALQLIENLLVTDLGSCFIDGQGRGTYLNRTSRYKNQSPVALLSGALVQRGIQNGIDKQLLYNSVTATRQFSQQTVTISGSPTGGTFNLTLDSQTASLIPYNATAAAVQTALAALSNIGASNVTCTGGPLPGTAVVVNLNGERSAMTADGTALTGGTSPKASVSASQASSTPQTVINAPSAHTYFTRVYPAQSSPNWPNDLAANSWAAFIGVMRGMPLPPAKKVGLVNRDVPSLMQQLTRELGDVVAVSFIGTNWGGQGNPGRGTILGIDETWDCTKRTVSTTYTIQEQAFRVFTVGVSVLGGPDLIGY